LPNATFAPEWYSTQNIFIGISDTGPLYSAGNSYSWNMIHESRAGLGGAGADPLWYSVILPFEQVDTSVIVVNPRGMEVTVRLRIADNSAFTTNALVLQTWTGITTQQRLVWEGRTRYSNLEYAQIEIERTGGAALVQAGLVEWTLGRRRQLSRGFSAPYENKPQGALVNELVSSARARSRAVYAYGFEDHNAAYHFSGLDHRGLFDLQSLLTIRFEAVGGRRNMWFRPRNDGIWLLGHFDGVQYDRLGYRLRRWNMRFTEHPPFASLES
jgi:hypothetical protein